MARQPAQPRPRPRPAAALDADEVAAATAIQGANPFLGLTARQVASAIARWGFAALRHPTVLAAESLRWGSEELRVLAGVCAIAPDAKDQRFADKAWQHPASRRVAQSYLLTRSTMLDSVDALGLDEKSANRARFALSQVTEATAPTNMLFGNPAALKQAAKTRGRSLVDGSRHMLYDVRHNGGLPSQVDTRPFRVGDTVAATRGAIIYRTPMFELIQYTPQTAKVHDRPTVIVPPQVNRYYFLDLSPQRSFIEHAIRRGIQVFCISWRNPTPEQRDWSMDDYARSCIEAMQVARSITRADKVNAAGFCAGGMTLSCVLSHLAATDPDLVESGTLAVTMINTEVTSTLNKFASERTLQAAISKSRRKGVLDGRALARVFA
jgi:polyhydroxyalkanoate synthase